MHRFRLACVLSLASASLAAAADLVVTPASVTLQGDYARAQLVVADGTGDRANDHTAIATFRSTNDKVVTVSAIGRLAAVGNGTAAIEVRANGLAKTVSVTVAGLAEKPQPGFSEHVMPILTKAGCNAGACHASQYGKGGFKLSVFSVSPNDDWAAIIRDSFGRRVVINDPAASLFLRKPTAVAAHEGGKRLDPASLDYRILTQWLSTGAPRPNATAPSVTGLRVEPARRIGTVGATQQLRAVATYSDGRSADVTHWAKFDTLDDSVIRVDTDGRMRMVGKGQGAALVRFEGQAVTATVVVPNAEKTDLAGWVDRNAVDRLAAAKFREIGIPPSGLCDDATFLRRAFFDATGTLPTVDQAKSFLDSKDPNKRAELVDRLLGLTNDPNLHVHDNDYAAFWALKWSDLIRSNSAQIGEQGMWALNNWLKDSFRQNKPFDRLVRELLTAKGSTFSNGPANYFRIAGNPQDLTEATTQLFLGVRLQCAKCHNHPFEPFTQTDYYSFAAFFARVGSKGSQEFGIFGNETVIMNRADGEVGHPKTGAILPPTPLRGKPTPANGDRRAALADWIGAKDNPYFARNIANRLFAYLMGRGLVEPIDDMRGTNPASNPELLDLLATEFIKSGYDQKKLLRLIMTSRLYQLDSKPTKANQADGKFYSHYLVKRVAAEPLLDAIDRATGSQTKFNKVPLGTRAIELPDAKYDNYFLNAFGKPRREAVCECERVSEPNLAQSLHMLNGDLIENKIADANGRIATLMNAKKSPDEVIEELYLATLSRRPTAAESATCKKLMAEVTDPRVFYQDLLWSLLNSKPFQFVH